MRGLVDGLGRQTEAAGGVLHRDLDRGAQGLAGEEPRAARIELDRDRTHAQFEQERRRKPPVAQRDGDIWQDSHSQSFKI